MYSGGVAEIRPFDSIIGEYHEEVFSFDLSDMHFHHEDANRDFQHFLNQSPFVFVNPEPVKVLFLRQTQTVFEEKQRQNVRTSKNK